jgi:pectin methylesterase-like acyl-CoA thioesterase
VPVVTLHTLGDLFVPFCMQQIYKRRATASGSDDMLVKRAIRGATHCDFTHAEVAQVFDDMVAWVQTGTRPADDYVLTPATVAAPTYGSTFTRNTFDADGNAGVMHLRQNAIAPVIAACPAS